MLHRPLLVLSLAALAAGCRDSTGSARREISVEVRMNSISAEEETIRPGQQIKLSAATLRSTGDEVDPQPKPRWSSTEPTVASVDTAGLVTGIRVGSTLIIAKVDSRADTVKVNVAEPVSGTLSCAASTVAPMAVGDVRTFTGPEAMDLCVPGTSAGAEYTLIPYNASEVAGAQLSVNIAAAGTASAVGPPSPARIPHSEALGELTANLAFHERLRERGSLALEPRLRSGSGLVPTAPLYARVPGVNDLLKLNVETAGSDGCTQQRDDRTGRVVYVSDRAIVVADTANPKGSPTGPVFTAADYQHFGETFDTLVWRIDTDNFGEPTDIDKNQRVIIFFTRAVNELTQVNSSSYVAGFFYNRDLFAKTGSNACAGSNVAEMFYLMVPDPAGEVNTNRRTANFVRTNTVGVLAHEFQHLINDSRRLYVNRSPVWEETWLNEGLSHIAEELLFYAAAGLQPGSNVDSIAQRSPAVAQAYNLYGADNVERLSTFLVRPQSSSLMGADELATRGAAWSFLRYAADRMPGDDRTMWKNLVGSKTRGLANLRAVLGTNPRDWIQDWGVSVYTDDAGFPVDSKYQQPSWNFRSLFPGLRSAFGLRLYTRLPLATVTLRPPGGTQTLSGGSMAYYRFRVPANETAALRTTVGSLPPPSRLRVALVRTK